MTEGVLSEGRMEQNKEVAKKKNRTRVSYKVKQEERELQNRLKEWYNQKNYQE